MKKVINAKVVASYNVDDKMMEIVQIYEQSHRGMKFGNNSDTFKAKNGVILTSATQPEVFYGGWEKYFVRGNNEKNDNIPMTMTADHRAKLYDAIREYNSFNFDDDIEEKYKAHKVWALFKTLDLGAYQEPVKKLVCALIDEIEAVKCAGMYK